MTKKLLALFSMILVLFPAAFAQQNVPNGYFNNWTNYNPNSWITANVTFVLGNDTSAFMETSGPGHLEGAASMKLTTIKLNNNPFAPTLPDTVGIAFTGAINFFTGQLTTGFPYAARPSAFDFYYKSDVMPGDTAWATVLLQKWNTMTNMRDTVAAGLWWTISDQPVWSLQSVPLSYNSALTNAYPDTAVVLFSSSSYSNPKIGSTLWIDGVTFTGWTGVEEMGQPQGVRVFPNPATTEISFSIDLSGAATIEVYDLTGRKIETVQVTRQKATLAVEGFTPGIYLYSILDESGRVMERGKFSTTR